MTIDEIKARLVECARKSKELADRYPGAVGVLIPCEHCARLQFLLGELARQEKYISNLKRCMVIT